ncbi:Intraflagellar transport protein 88, partial [Coemansia sp. Cherry 401B]
MSFVDEHYARVFRLLAAGRSGSPSPQGVESGESSVSGDRPLTRGPEGSQLAERAFDLATQLLTEPNSSQSGGAQTTRDLDKDDGSGRRTGGSFRPASSSAKTVCPSLPSILGDLQLVYETASHHADAAAANSGTSSAAELVLLNAVAAIHAHTVRQLLRSVLPLAVDVDYWSARDSGALPLAAYFIQSLPQRLYSWASHAMDVVRDCNADRTTQHRGLITRLRTRLSSKYLFAEAGRAASDRQRAQDWQPAMRIPKVPSSVNILRLVRHEIRCKQRQLVAMQQVLASGIGELSQAASMESVSVTAEELLLQVVNLVDSLVGSSTTDLDPDRVRAWHEQPTTTHVFLIQAVANRVSAIPDVVSRQMGPCGRPSLATRSWIPAAVLLVGARWISTYVVGHRNDLKEWMADGLFTLRNYISQYILTPLQSAYETIRYGKHTYNVMSETSLASDFKSLEDMVIGFAGRFGNIDPEIVRNRVEHGDLSDVMQVYARELQRPFRNVVFGDLVQAMLIQVQKVKVDVGQTMAALDKLLKSNELNFLLLSTVPATLSIYAAAEWISKQMSWWISGSSRHTVASIQIIVRDIDRLLNTDSVE